MISRFYLKQELPMKIISSIALSLACVQLATPASIEIVQQEQNNAWSYSAWSYKVLSRATASATLACTPLETFRKEATICFDSNAYEIVVQVYQNTKAMGQHEDVYLKKDGENLYQDNNITVLPSGIPLLMRKNGAPFAATKKVSVEKDSNDKQLWDIRAVSSNEDEAKDGLPFQYGQVTIKKKTGPAKRLIVPEHRAFTVYVEGEGLPNAMRSHFTAEQAKNLKTIKVDSKGNAFPIN